MPLWYYNDTSANFIRVGCGLRLVLPINPTAVATLTGEGSNTAHLLGLHE